MTDLERWESFWANYHERNRDDDVAEFCRHLAEARREEWQRCIILLSTQSFLGTSKAVEALKEYPPNGSEPEKPAPILTKQAFEMMKAGYTMAKKLNSGGTMYQISWCKETSRFLGDNGVEYYPSEFNDDREWVVISPPKPEPAFPIGTRVVKNPETWEPNDFDAAWGRGQGIGVVVAPEMPLGSGDVDVRWPTGRCFERAHGLMLAPPEPETFGIEEAVRLA